jgi:hypothetical protein
MDGTEMLNMKFADGTIISVVADGCGNWLSDDITSEMLTADNLSHVEVGDIVLEDQVCEGIYPYDGTKGFFLRDKTYEEKLQETLDIYEDAIAELAELIGG